jgi:hypothetical protein
MGYTSISPWLNLSLSIFKYAPLKEKVIVWFFILLLHDSTSFTWLICMLMEYRWIWPVQYHGIGVRCCLLGSTDRCYKQRDPALRSCCTFSSDKVSIVWRLVANVNTLHLCRDSHYVPDIGLQFEKVLRWIFAGLMNLKIMLFFAWYQLSCWRSQPEFASVCNHMQWFP